MNKYVMVVLSDESKAYEAVHQLRELHREGSISVYGTAVIQRDASGAVSVRERSDEGPLGMGVGALAGALIGVFGGPVGVAAGVAAGATAGLWRDYLNAELSDEFLEEVQRNLVPGKFAVIAEVEEEWVAPINTRMEVLGGTVVRELRQKFAEDLIQKRVEARRKELEQRKAERAEKAGRMQARLQESIEDARQRLQATAEKAQKRLDESKAELQEKLRALEEQAAKAKSDVRDRIQQRIAELRADFQERQKKLNRAYELTKEALGPSAHA